MGVKDLWTILGPFCERKPLYELQGNTVAIDLSCWVCEAQNISEYQVQPRMYLRNLYFRACYLLLLGVNPVFVLEGKAPTLKYDTIAARNMMQFKGAKPRNNKDDKLGKDRSRFNFTLKQCEEMLKYMGLVCIKGTGEAEAMCAHLNAEGLVQGCISQDSDCFAYGAKRVYRNFSISQQGMHSASGGAIDVYDIEKLTESSGFGRYKIIALALLCGSDYCDGVFGIGKDSALKLFEKVPDNKILDRLRSWRCDTAFYNDQNAKITNKNICTSCGHFGKLQSHNKKGCSDCNQTSGCDSSKFKDERLAIKNELNIRAKALQDPDFPNEKLISEFLTKKDNVLKLNLKWRQPDLINFVKFTAKYLQWEEVYAFEKFLPIVTRWQLLNYNYVQKIKSEGKVKSILYADYIKKIRNPKGTPSYEIIWKGMDDYFKDLIPGEQLEGVSLEKLWSTIEPQHLLQEAHPELVEKYQQSRVKPKKITKRKKNTVAEIENLLQNTTISEPKPKTQKRETKRRVKKAVDELERSFADLNVGKSSKMKQKTMDSYIKKAIANNIKIITDDHDSNVLRKDTNMARDFQCVSLYDSFDPNLSNFGDESDMDLSAIIDDVVNCQQPNYIKENLQKLSKFNANENVKLAWDSESSFFITSPTENDFFETTFQRHYSDEDTEDYDELQMLIDENVPNSQLSSSMNSNSDESFSIDYVPLVERLKNKN